MAMPHLDQNADRVVKRANEIAREYEMEYVGTEHVLLAILREGEGLGAAVLKRFGVDEAGARKVLDRLLQHDKEDTWVFGRLPGTPHFRNVMALAIDEATELGDQAVRSEHLLLGLLRESGALAERVLREFDITLDKARKTVVAEGKAADGG